MNGEHNGACPSDMSRDALGTRRMRLNVAACPGCPDCRTRSGKDLAHVRTPAVALQRPRSVRCVPVSAPLKGAAGTR